MEKPKQTFGQTFMYSTGLYMYFNRLIVGGLMPPNLKTYYKYTVLRTVLSGNRVEKLINRAE